MHYTLIANSVDPDQVEERTINGDRHLVAKDVTFIRPMELAGGYVPEQSVANSAPDWDRSPLTINHPKNLPDRPWYDPDHDGFYVSANRDDEVRQRKVVGHAENPSRNGDGSVDADLAVNVDRVEAIADGEAVANEDAEAAEALLDALENGDPFDVSSQYFPQPLPPGTYDGAHRDQAEAIANADSIALLPTKSGVCSLEDGCGFKPQQATANADVVRAPVANADVDDWSDAAADDPETGEDTVEGNTNLPDGVETRDGREAAKTIAHSNGGADLTDGLDLDNPDDETKQSLGERLLTMLGWDSDDEETSNEPAESGVDVGSTPAANSSDPADEPGSTMDNREQLINEITSNSAITAESLEDACDERVELIHEDVTANTDPTGNGGSSGDTLADMSVDDLAGALADQGFVTEDGLEDVVANAQEQSEKEQRVERIVANSSEYDEDDKETLLETPEPVLEDIEAGVSSNATLPGASGAAGRATANAAGGDDLDDYSDGTIGGDL
ncbi:hypothetical protein [Natrinema ejinorense]|uniref:DUF2213 domain-containing protein n=1 Tax=Natrinema ejinorense TaxID=373386 RepID=A0A2A5QR68_9EURY|nr:hypothetical protein [Natrinema ejinorense]PCR89312.1 hypothetical protein CP557_01425 [Natrinema ejinorense]